MCLWKLYCGGMQYESHLVAPPFGSHLSSKHFFIPARFTLVLHGGNSKRIKGKVVMAHSQFENGTGRVGDLVCGPGVYAVG